MKTININLRDGYPMIFKQSKLTSGVNLQMSIFADINEGDHLELSGKIFNCEAVHETRPAKGDFGGGEIPTFYNIDIVEIGKVEYIKTDSGELNRIVTLYSAQ